MLVSKNNHGPVTFTTSSNQAQGHTSTVGSEPHYELWYSRTASSLRSAGYTKVGPLHYARVTRGYRFDVYCSPSGRSHENATVENRVVACSTAPGESSKASVTLVIKDQELRTSQIQKFESRSIRALRALLG